MYEPGEFSVTQFFSDDEYETMRHHVSSKDAMEAFIFYTRNVAARVGLTVRVIITDGGDCINYEWQYGKGITFPPPEEMERIRKENATTSDSSTTDNRN